MVGVSFDGTWQRRGHSSLNGVWAAISITTWKVLDCEVLSRYCKNCALHIPLKETNPAVYESWKVDHEGKCHLNHEGSTSSMESAAAVAVFSRSFKHYGLRYTKILWRWRSFIIFNGGKHLSKHKDCEI